MMGGMMGGMGGMGGDMSDKMRGAMDKVKGGMNKMGGKGMGLMKALKQCMCETCQREDSCMDIGGSGEPAGSQEGSEEGPTVDCEANKYVVMAAGKKGEKTLKKKTKKIQSALKKYKKAVDKAVKKNKKGKDTQEEIEEAAGTKAFKKVDMEDVKAYREYLKCTGAADEE